MYQISPVPTDCFQNAPPPIVTQLIQIERNSIEVQKAEVNSNSKPTNGDADSKWLCLEINAFVLIFQYNFARIDKSKRVTQHGITGQRPFQMPKSHSMKNQCLGPE